MTRVISFSTGPNQGNGNLLTATFITAVTSVIAMEIQEKEDFTPVRMPILIATSIAVPTVLVRKCLKRSNLRIILKSLKTSSERILVLSLKI